MQAAALQGVAPAQLAMARRSGMFRWAHAAALQGLPDSAALAARLGFSCRQPALASQHLATALQEYSRPGRHTAAELQSARQLLKERLRGRPGPVERYHLGRALYHDSTLVDTLEREITRLPLHVYTVAWERAHAAVVTLLLSARRLLGRDMAQTVARLVWEMRAEWPTE